MSIQGTVPSKWRTASNGTKPEPHWCVWTGEGAQGVDQAAFNRPANVNDALQYFIYLLFDRLHYLILNYDLYSTGEEWKELGQFKIIVDRIPQVFEGLPNSIVQVFKVERPSPPRPAIVELDEGGNVVNLPVAESTSFGPIYSNRTGLYWNSA